MIKKRIISFAGYIKSNSHLSGNTLVWFKKFRRFILGYRHSKMITAIVLNLYSLKLYLKMNSYAVYKYGIFCFICVNRALTFATRSMAFKTRSSYVAAP